jgi:excinuclease ABC subunit C
MNELEKIKGIGKNTADTLLKKFRSVKKIKELERSELEKEVGRSRAEIIYRHFHTEKSESF